MNAQDHVHGLKIRTFNYLMILIACVLYALLLFETIQVFKRYDALADATNDYIRCEEYANQVSQGSDILTNQARLYVMTSNLSYLRGYFQEANVDRKRDRALEAMADIHPNDKVYEYLQTALDYSNALMDREIYAMTLVSTAQQYNLSSLPQEIQDTALTKEDLELPYEDQMRRAQNMVFDDGYQDAKTLIQNNIAYCMNSTLQYMQGIHASSETELQNTIQNQRFLITLLFVMNIIIFFFITILIIRPLQIYIKCISNNKMLEIIGSYEFKYLALTYNSIYELNAANEVMLRKQAEHDALTGIMNRGAFEKMKLGLKGYPISIALLIIDVDHFKQINDKNGHTVGDKVLKWVAFLLARSFRSSDYVARVGGDEFCVVMINTSPQLREHIEQKIAEINQMLHDGTDELPATSLSVGVSFSDHGFDDELYQQADSALYVSKESGRGRCTFYHEPAPPKQPPVPPSPV